LVLGVAAEVRVRKGRGEGYRDEHQQMKLYKRQSTKFIALVQRKKWFCHTKATKNNRKN